MKLKTLLIVISALLVLTLIPLSAVQPGGGTTPAGNCPCFSTGEIVSEGSWYTLGGNYMTVIETYIGNCQIRQEFYCNGNLIETYYYEGGCYCACPISIKIDTGTQVTD